MDQELMMGFFSAEARRCHIGSILDVLHGDNLEQEDGLLLVAL
jgi:hypothetical protein